MKRTLIQSQTVLFISISLFVISLTQHAYCTEGSCVPAFGAFLTGWTAFYMAGPMLTWFANPMLFVAWSTIGRRPVTSLIFSMLALITMLSFLFFKTIYNHQDEWESQIVAYKPGYWLWVLSALSILIGNPALYATNYNLKNKGHKKLDIVPIITLVVMATALTIITGFSRKKSITLLDRGCVIDYKYGGNLDSDNEKYIATYRGWALCYCEKYNIAKDSITGERIRLLYNKFGRPFKPGDSKYIRLDAIVKYRRIIF